MDELYRVQWLSNRQIFLAIPPLFLIPRWKSSLKTKNNYFHVLSPNFIAYFLKLFTEILNCN